MFRDDASTVSQRLIISGRTGLIPGHRNPGLAIAKANRSQDFRTLPDSPAHNGRACGTP
jgi:hypothetical protein